MSDRGSADGGDGAGVVRHEAPAIELHRHKRVCILVLGMHRSGTSAFARVLSLLGAELPKKLLDAGIGNKTGHWESEPLVAFHDRMLAALDSRWDDWRKLDFERFGSARLASIRNDLAHVLADQYGSAALLVLKDPRICRFVPLYREALAGLGLEPRCVIPLRNPLAVVASLGARNGMTEGFASLLWLRHVLEAEAETRGWPRSIVSYEALLADWQSAMRRTTARLGLAWPRPFEEAAAEVAAFLSAEHQHHAPSRRELAARRDVADWVKAAYEALLRLEQDQDDELAFAQLDRIRQEFEAVSAPFGAAMFSELAAREARFEAERNRIAAEAAGVRTILGVREGDLARARNELAARDRRVGALQARLAARKGRAFAQKEALVKRDAQIMSLRNDVAARDERIGAAEAMRKLKEQEVASLRSELITLKEVEARWQALSETHRRDVAARDERIDALEAALAQRISEDAALRGEFAAREQRIAELQAAVAERRALIEAPGPASTAESELSSLREALSGKDEHISALQAALTERDAREKTTAKTIVEQDNRLRMFERRLADAEATNHAYRQSTSWRLTAPLRAIKTSTAAISGTVRTVRSAIQFGGGLRPTLKKAFRVYRKEGSAGIKYRYKFVATIGLLRDDAAAFREPAVPDLPASAASGGGRDHEFPSRRPARVRQHTATVDIIVCVHNALDDVRACLASVTQHTTPPYHLIIVNDGSDEPTLRFLRDFMLGQAGTIIEHGSALGYTRAANAGLRASNAEFLVLLNSDTVVSPLWLDRLIECVESDPSIGMVGPLSNTASWQSVPRVLENDDWSKNALPEGLGVAEVSALVARCSARTYPRVGFLNGFCLLIRRDLMSAIGYFDDATFGEGYGEENDYCLRAVAAGWSLAVADDAYVFHSQSKSYSNERRRELVARSDRALQDKHGQRIYPLLNHTKENMTLASCRARTSVMLERMHTGEAIRRRHEGRRILFLLPVCDAGGGANIVITEALAMLRAGVDVSLANLSSHRVAFEASYGDLCLPLLYLSAPEDLPGVLHQFDAVVATVFTSVAWLGAVPPSDLVLGYYVQDYEPYFFDQTNRLHAAALDSYRLIPSASLFTKTNWTAREVRRHTGVEVRVIGPSYDCDRFFPIDKPAGGPVRVAAMVRPSTPRRAPERTAAILEGLGRCRAGQVEIHIFGVSPEHQLVRDIAGSSSGFVHGHVGPDTMAGILASADIFCDFSEYQAMGLTALEAMSCGSAVVGPARGGLSEIVVHRHNGLIVDTTKTDDCYEALLGLVDDAVLRRSLALNALSDVAHHFPERAALNMLDELFQRRN